MRHCPRALPLRTKKRSCRLTRWDAALNKVLAEKQAGKTTDGTVDMIWINGENFRTMADASILYTAWARNLPNAKLINWDQPIINSDFGIPVNDREAPWARAQFVFLYDTAKVPTAPKSFTALEAYLKANPGTFTVPRAAGLHRQRARSPRPV